MHSTTSSERRSRSTRVRRRPLLVAGVLAGGAMLVKMNHVPANLDDHTTRTSQGGLFNATYTPSVTPVPINELHAWTLHLETPDGTPIEGARIHVDGDMPQHGHGLPTHPQVTRNLGNGDYLVEGLKFQMGGWWVMDFKVTTQGRTDTVRFNLMLNE